MRKQFAKRHQQQGVALAVALILLLVITILAVAGARYSTVELRMALNQEIRVAAFEFAQSVVDATISDPDNTPVVGDVGDTTCSSNLTDCTRNDLALPEEIQYEVNADRVSVVVERMEPAVGPPPRGLQTSLALFGATYFQVQGSFDRAAEGQGRAQINEGLIVLVPNY